MEQGSKESLKWQHAATNEPLALSLTLGVKELMVRMVPTPSLFYFPGKTWLLWSRKRV